MKHIFFDLDRTLWDFEKNSEKALHQLFHELKLDDHIPSFSVFHHLYKKKNAELWKLYGAGKITKEELRTRRFSATLSSFGVINDDLTETISQGYIEISPRQTQLFPSAIETLNKLQQMDYQMHIITNGFKEVQYIKLENSGLAEFFNVVVCSEEVGKNKPAPDIFFYAMNLAKAKAEQSVMIGDDLDVDIIGAQNAGIKGILFDPQNLQKKIHGITKIASLDVLPEIIPTLI